MAPPSGGAMLSGRVPVIVAYFGLSMRCSDCFCGGLKSGLACRWHSPTPGPATSHCMWATTPRRSGAAAELGRAAGLAPRRFQYMNQVHGNDVPPRCDRAAAGQRNCTPRAPRRMPWSPWRCRWPSWWPTAFPWSWSATPAAPAPVLGVVHAGRPGAGLGGHSRSRGRAARSRRQRTSGAWLGPSICGRCYEVPAELRDGRRRRRAFRLVHHLMGNARRWTCRPARASQLEAAGVPIEYRGPCTLENDNLFSYRRNTGTRAGSPAWCGPMT